jgi:peptidoglycan/LPS O-acetylase OafA/YrhL
VFSATLLLFGYLLGGSERFWVTCEKYRFQYLAVAAACIGFLYFSYWRQFAFPKQKDFRLYQYGFLNAVHIWLLILSVLGFAKKHLNFRNAFLTYTNQAVYPFYILHQTIIVATGFYIVQWNLPIVIKLLILIVVCFTLLTAIYQWLIRPFVLTRILYGLKPQEPKRTSQPTTQGSVKVQMVVKE